MRITNSCQGKGVLCVEGWASGILRKMGLPELITENNDEYVSLAVRLAQDTSYKHYIRQKLLANRELVFEDSAPIRALEDFISSVVVKQPSCDQY